MNSDTVYLKVSQITEVYEPDVRLKDIAEIHCQNRTVEAKLKAMKVTSFKNPDGKIAGTVGRKRVQTYVGSVVELLAKAEAEEKNIQINSLGEADFVVKYRPDAGGRKLFQWFKTAVVAVVAFCGAAFAIMTFNNDANVSQVFANLYRLVTGLESDGTTVLELSYSVGLALGILLFFNHFASWKITVDPTPIEVEMRLYEENLNKALIRNQGRKETGTDVS
ncbi:MAG: stage V sporulation protein AA [Lachnospiraceae bacterium]|nr:stage V sporulation protein AA [Lachnospiraceae bacterium]